jgi:hypothetical protein
LKIWAIFEVQLLTESFGILSRYFSYTKPLPAICRQTINIIIIDFMKNNSENWNIFNWILFVVFASLGVLNMIFVHIVPGLIYLLISLIYLPYAINLIKNKIGFSIPIFIKIILAILFLWLTLGVGDLMELLESWAIK